MKYILSAFLLLILCACEKDTAFPDNPIDPDRVDFRNPQVGQFNDFVELSYECGSAEINSQEEIRLEITAVTEDEITFTESQGGIDLVYTADREPNRLVISEEERFQSRLFYFYGSDYLNLTGNNSKIVSQKDCAFYDGKDKFTGDYMTRTFGFTADREYDGKYTVVSCVPLILGLDGYLIYDEHTLTASMTAFESEFGGVVSRYTTWYVLKE